MKQRFAIAALGFVACVLAACTSPDESSSSPSGTATVTESIAVKDSLGTNGSQFFPLGLLVEGGKRGTVANGGVIYHYYGGPPLSDGDTTRYFDDITKQTAALGINSMIFVNADDAEGQNLLSASSSADLYVDYTPSGFCGLKSPTVCTGGSKPGAQCASNADCPGSGTCGPVAPCTAACNMSQSQVQQLVQTASSTFSSSPALQDYYVVDEPTEPCIVDLRYASQALSTIDPGHTGTGTISVLPIGLSQQTATCAAQPSVTCGSNADCFATPGDWCNFQARTRILSMDKAFAYDHVTTDVSYPFATQTYVGQQVPLETWDGEVDLAYEETPLDKPLQVLIQADHYDYLNLRTPTPAEVRYMTYAALARGVKGIYWFFYQQDNPQAGGIADYGFNMNSNALEIQRLASELRVLVPWLIDATRDYVSKTVAPIASVTSVTANGSTNFSPTAYDDDTTSLTTKFGEKLVMVVNEHLAHAYCSATTLQVCDSSADCPSGETCTCPPNETCDSTGTPYPRSFHVQAQMPSALIGKLPGGCCFTVRDLRTNTNLTSSLAGSTLSFDTPSFQPGDGTLFQLQSPLSAEVRIARGSYANPISSSKGVSVTLTAKNVGTTTWTTAGHHLGIHVYAPDGTRSDITGLALGGNVLPGATVQLTIAIAAGTLSQTGTYGLGFDVYQDGTPNIWFVNEQRLSVMVLPNPLLVDTFDSVPYNHPASSLWKWASSPLMSLRNDMVAVNGGGVHLSAWGDSWTDYTFEFDAMIDSESRRDASSAGWVVRTKSTSPNVGYLFRLAADDATDPTVAPGSIQVFTTTDAASSNQIATFVANKQCSGGTNVGATCVSDTTCTGGGHCLTSLKRGTVYHIKEVVSGQPNPGVTISTYVNGMLRNTLVDTTCTGCTGGGVGFRLFEASGCQAGGTSGVEDKYCVGGTSAGKTCVYDSDCTGGGTCPDQAEDCLPGLERGHYDNVSVYTSGTPATPAQVTGLAVAATSANQLQLSWQRVQDTTTGGARVSSYRVYRGTSPSSLSVVAEPSEISYVDANVTAGTTYYYAVSAVNNVNVEGAQSTQASGSVALPTASGVSTTVNDMKSVTVSWTGSASKYEVHRGTPGFTASLANLVATVTSTSYSDSPANTFVTDAQIGLSGLSSYQYAIVPLSTNASGNTIATGAAALSGTVATPGSSLFSDAFLNSSKWTTCSGTWSANGVYHQTSTAGVSTATITPNRELADMAVEFTVQIVNDPSDSAGQNWVGITIHKSTSSSSCTKLGDAGYSGYLIYYRSNGRIEIYDPTRGVVAWAATGLDPKTAARKVRVDTTGRSIKVSVNGTLFLSWSVPLTESLLKGYLDLTTYKVAADYDNMNIFFRDDFNSYNGQMVCTVPANTPCTTNADCSGGGICGGPAYGTLIARDNWSTVVEGSNTQAPFDLSAVGQLQFDANSTCPGVADSVAPLDLVVGNFEADYALKIASACDSQQWAAFAFRKTHIGDNEFTSGYMVYWRSNGSLELYKAGGGVLQTAGLFATTNYQLVHVSAQGGRIRVSVNGTQVIDYTDPTPYTSGYVHLEASQTKAAFEFLEIY